LWYKFNILNNVLDTTMFDEYVGYARRSADEDDLSWQVQYLTANKCSTVFQEEGISTERPILNDCLKHLTAGDTLVICRLDRIGRSLKDLLEMVLALDAKGVNFCSLYERIDTRTDDGKNTLTLFRAFAEYESNRIRESTLVGLATARAAGRVGGRKPKLTEEQLVEIREQLKRPGACIDSIAKSYGVTRSTLYRNKCVS
jgi:DNA invertase Pin-like site-specific DNA recombinase